jgi:predicted RNA-binding Zn ribbon-like protein
MEFQIVAGEISLDFINTLDNRPLAGQQKELLTAYRDLADWALQAGAVGPQQRAALLQAAAANPDAAAATLHQAVELRECLNRIVSSHLRKRRPAPGDLALFSCFLAESHTHLQLQAERSGFRLGWPAAESRLDSLLWPIVKSSAALLTSTDLHHVRECDAAECRWVFLDRSKNHSRRWCDMTVCGNRVKAHKFYQRRRGAL